MIMNELRSKIMTRNIDLKSALIMIIKIVISLASLTFITHTVDWAEMGKVLLQAQMYWIYLALLIFWVAQVFSAIRCKYIACVLGGTISLQTSLKAHFVGLWFNQVLPTSLGGDVIKIAILKRTIGLSIAIRSTLLDRVSGLMFLLLVVSLTLPFYFDIFSHQPEISLALGVFSLASLVGIILFSWFSHNRQKSRTLHSIIQKLIQFFADIARFRFRGVLWQQFWTSAIVHFNGIIAYSLLGLAMGVDIDPLTLLLIVPLVFLIALLPISFAGWGLREAGAIWLFGMVGVTSEIALAMSIIFGLLLIVAALPGLLIFIYKPSSD